LWPMWFVADIVVSHNFAGLWLQSFEFDFGCGLTELQGSVGPWWRLAFH